MSDMWIKIKFWAKTTLISVIVVYALMFIFKNSGETVKFWWFPLQDSLQTSVLYLTVSVFFAGVITTVLFRTTMKTVQQFRLLQAAKASRELAEMQTKAARLQTRPANTTATNIDPNLP